MVLARGEEDVTTPEERARETIDAKLAESGWVIRSREETNLSAGLGVEIREFPMANGMGNADYLLFANGEAVGILEAERYNHMHTISLRFSLRNRPDILDRLHGPEYSVCIVDAEQFLSQEIVKLVSCLVGDFPC